MTVDMRRVVTNYAGHYSDGLRYAYAIAFQMWQWRRWDGNTRLYFEDVYPLYQQIQMGDIHPAELVVAQSDNLVFRPDSHFHNGFMVYEGKDFNGWHVVYPVLKGNPDWCFPIRLSRREFRQDLHPGALVTDKFKFINKYFMAVVPVFTHSYIPEWPGGAVNLYTYRTFTANQREAMNRHVVYLCKIHAGDRIVKNSPGEDWHTHQIAFQEVWH